MAWGKTRVRRRPIDVIKSYKYRYVIGVIYTLMSLQNILMWLIFAPMQSNLKEAYGHSIFVINLGTLLISSICYIPANFLATSLIDAYGLRFGTILGGVLTTIGLWIRFLCEDGFHFIFIGQCFAGLAQPFLYSTPPKISNIWFPIQQENIVAIAIAVSMNIGSAFSAFIPQFFVDLSETDPAIFLSQLRHLMLYMAIAGSIFLVLTILLLKNKPPIPPNVEAGHLKLFYWESMKLLRKEKNAMLFIIVSAASSAGMAAYIRVLRELVAPYGINGVQVGNILLIGILTGFIGATAIGFYVTKAIKFKKSLIFLAFMATVAMVGNYFAATSGNAYIFGAAFCIYVFFIAPVMPLAIETSGEYAFPIIEAASAWVWLMFYQAFSLVEAFAVDAFLNEVSHDTPVDQAQNYSLNGFILMAAYQFVMGGLMLVPREKLERFIYQDELSIGMTNVRRDLSGKAVISATGGGCLMFEGNLITT